MEGRSQVKPSFVSDDYQTEVKEELKQNQQRKQKMAIETVEVHDGRQERLSSYCHWLPSFHVLNDSLCLRSLEVSLRYWCTLTLLHVVI